MVGRRQHQAQNKKMWVGVWRSNVQDRSSDSLPIHVKGSVVDANLGDKLPRGTTF